MSALRYFVNRKKKKKTEAETGTAWVLAERARIGSPEAPRVQHAPNP